MILIGGFGSLILPCLSMACAWAGHAKSFSYPRSTLFRIVYPADGMKSNSKTSRGSNVYATVAVLSKWATD